MAVTSIMTTESEINAKAGDGASAGYTEAMKDARVLQAEAMVNWIGDYDYSTNWAALTAVYKPVLGELVAAMVAIEWISYDMNGYTDITEAVDMVNILTNNVLFGLSNLRNPDRRAKIIGT